MQGMRSPKNLCDVAQLIVMISATRRDVAIASWSAASLLPRTGSEQSGQLTRYKRRTNDALRTGTRRPHFRPPEKRCNMTKELPGGRAEVPKSLFRGNDGAIGGHSLDTPISFYFGFAIIYSCLKSHAESLPLRIAGRRLR